MIAGDQIVGVAFHGASKDRVIIGISTGPGADGSGNLNRVQMKQRQRSLDLIITKAILESKRRPGENGFDLMQKKRRRDQQEPSGPPGIQQIGLGAATHQQTTDDLIGVKNDAIHAVLSEHR